MHISKDYKTTLEFSKKLARATRVKKGWRVLDMFLGLGYSAGEILNAGAAEVVCFEVRGENIAIFFSWIISYSRL